MVRLCESNIIFPCMPHPSICPSGYLLLNHWTEFSQTCYITSPHGMVVWEQHYFSVRASSVHLFVTLSSPKPLGGIQPTCYMTSPHGKVVWEQHYFSFGPLSVHMSITYLLLNHWVEFNQTCYITSPHGMVVWEQHYFSLGPLSVHMSITLPPPKPLSGVQPNLLHYFPSWLGCGRATSFFCLSVWHLFICPSC